jgi:hypothetical protein
MDKNNQVITAPFIEGIKACLSDGTQIRRQCSVATKDLVSQLFELIRHKQKLSIQYVFTLPISVARGNLEDFCDYEALKDTDYSDSRGNIERMWLKYFPEEKHSFVFSFRETSERQSLWIDDHIIVERIFNEPKCPYGIDMEWFVKWLKKQIAKEYTS